MTKHKFTVIWGNIGDGHERRLDHVETENRDFSEVILAAKRIAYSEIALSGPDDPYTFEEFCDEMYDGYAIFDGHLSESPFI